MAFRGTLLLYFLVQGMILNILTVSLKEHFRTVYRIMYFIKVALSPSQKVYLVLIASMEIL